MDEEKVRMPALWGKPDSEQLYNYTKDEAIEMILDSLDAPLPETIQVSGYARMVPDFEAFAPLEGMLRDIDAEYGDPEEDTEPTQAMIDAEAALMAAIKADYLVWACEEVCRETINVMDWIKANKPNWL
jgi:hypothetical protein